MPSVQVQHPNFRHVNQKTKDALMLQVVSPQSTVCPKLLEGRQDGTAPGRKLSSDTGVWRFDTVIECRD